MSVLPPIADMFSALAHICFGPIADISFDYLIGGRDQRGRYGEAEGLGNLEVG